MYYHNYIITNNCFNQKSTNKTAPFFKTILLLIFINTFIKSSNFCISKDGIHLQTAQLSNPLLITKHDPIIFKEYSWKDKDIYIWAFFICDIHIRFGDKSAYPEHSLKLAFLVGEKDVISNSITSKDLLLKIAAKDLLVLTSGTNLYLIEIAKKFDKKIIRSASAWKNCDILKTDIRIKQSKFGKGIELNKKSFAFEKVNFEINGVFTSDLYSRLTPGMNFTIFDLFYNVILTPESAFSEFFTFYDMDNITTDQLKGIDEVMKDDTGLNIPIMVGFILGSFVMVLLCLGFYCYKKRK